MTPLTGHSLVKHLLLGWLICYVDVLYISLSPYHYWQYPGAQDG